MTPIHNPTCPNSSGQDWSIEGANSGVGSPGYDMRHTPIEGYSQHNEDINTVPTGHTVLGLVIWSDCSS